LARLPASWMTVLPVPNASLRRDFAHDYVDKSLFGPVISIEDEFLDTLLLRTALKQPADKPLLNPPYRMVVRLSARDNRMKEEGDTAVPSHQEGTTSESFEFTVVSEQDVLIEAGRHEEDVRDRFEENIAALTKLRTSLKRIRDDLETPSAAKEEDVRRAVSDAQDATKA